MTPPEWTTRAWSIILLTFGVFLGCCIFTYQPADIPLLSVPHHQPVLNWGGALGSWIAFVSRGGFGWASMLLPLLCLLWAWRCWTGKLLEVHFAYFAIALVCLLSGTGTLLAYQFSDPQEQVRMGGLLGFLFSYSGSYYIGSGTPLAAVCVALLGWLVVGGRPDIDLRDFFAAAGRKLTFFRRVPDEPRPRQPRRQSEKDSPAPKPELTIDEKPMGYSSISPSVKIRQAPEPKKTKPKPISRPSLAGYELPPVDFLMTPPPASDEQIAEDLQGNAKILEETLREFGVEATVANIDRGPTLTRYELVPAPGVKLNRIVGLADDLALVLKATSCHVVAPIPGKGRIGVDVPNQSSHTVYLKELVSDAVMADEDSPLMLAIGKDVSGKPVAMDLRDCPHLLIAGATGSGKTVCINSIIVGMLLRASPDQVKFLMVDPKMVEMASYNDLPHLVVPVVTDTKKAATALYWAVHEMERRYKLLARVGVRHITQYNDAVEKGSIPQSAELPEDSEELSESGQEGKLPYIVVVVDELADLMMVAAQDVEGAITRLAQLSRAVGIHMVLATQRPSVDVITGVIKANFPARIAFQVASKVDSRTILHMNGADKLIGRGDLLFFHPGKAKPIRAQGTFVKDEEIERVTEFVKQQQEARYDEALLEKQQQPVHMLNDDKDEMYESAKEVVLNAGAASTSLLQRRLRIGYGRAARILDLMEQEGIVGPPQGSKPREVLISREGV